MYRIINPEELGVPRGWNHGLLARDGGRILFVAGQTAADTGPAMAEMSFEDQFDAALGKVLQVVEEAGGGPESVGRMTLFVTDLPAYLESRPALGERWRARMGRHYPAMALVEVCGLVEEGALVEIEATAVVG